MLLVPATAAAADRYASPTGEGVGHGTCPDFDPCPIDAAVEGSGVDAGDTVHLAPGDYEVTDPLELGNVTVLGGPDVTITNTIGGYAAVYVGAHGLIADVRVTAGSAGRALWVSGRAERIVAIGNGTSNGACFVSHQNGFTPAPYFRDSVCYAEGLNAKAVELQVGCGTPQDTLEHSTIVNVTAVAEGTNSHGVFLSTASGCKQQYDLLNVIAHGDGADLFARTDGDAASQARIIATASAYDSVDTENAGFVTASGAGTNITRAPAFVNAAGGDFRQAPGSPTIDAGVSGSFASASDFQGERRPQGASYDIGADERDTDAPAVRVPGRLQLKPNNVISAKLRCSAREASPPCRGKLQLKTRKRVEFRGKRRKVKLATARFEMGAPAAKTVRLRLPAAKADLLRSSNAARKVIASVVARDAAGNKGRSAKHAQIKPR